MNSSNSVSNVVTTIISGKNKMKEGSKVTEIERARKIMKSLGIKVAARYLKNRDWSIEASMYILLGK